MADVGAEGGYAFPVAGAGYHGMTLRDWFAGCALIGLLAKNLEGEAAVDRAYDLAELMLERREETSTGRG